MFLKERMIIGQNKEQGGSAQIEADQKCVGRLLSLSLCLFCNSFADPLVSLN